MNATQGGRECPAADNAAANEDAVSTRPDGVLQRIAALSDLVAQQLRDEWRRLYRGQPPRLSRDLLIRSLAYRIQELSYGGLSKATQRTLVGLAKEMAAKGNITITPEVCLRPGARLVREWRGRTHTVVVKEDGFEFAGKTYLSLTKIAHVITRAHWSGPRFFGLNRTRTPNVQLGPDAIGSAMGEVLANG